MSKVKAIFDALANNTANDVLLEDVVSNFDAVEVKALYRAINDALANDTAEPQWLSYLNWLAEGREEVLMLNAGY